MSFESKTIREKINWSYANLAAYQIALKQTPPKYFIACYKQRSKLYKGLMEGTMSMQSIYLNERKKLKHAMECAYCGKQDVPLTLDHLFPKSKGGSDSGDNLVYVCKSCNSSKSNMDYFAWIKKTGIPVKPEIAERYLKNAYQWCEEHGILDNALSDVPSDLPFDLDAVPLKYSIENL